jgi:hypothetical protein
MSFDYTITNLKSVKDLKNKEKEYFENLRLRQKLNQKYDEALTRRAYIEKYDVGMPLPPLEKSLVEERSDVNLQYSQVLRKLNGFLRPEVATEVIGKLTEPQVVELNLYFEAIKKLIPLAGRDITADYFLAVLRRYREFLVESGNTGFAIPKTDRGLMPPPPLTVRTLSGTPLIDPSSGFMSRGSSAPKTVEETGSARAPAPASSPRPKSAPTPSKPKVAFKETAPEEGTPVPKTKRQKEIDRDAILGLYQVFRYEQPQWEGYLANRKYETGKTEQEIAKDIVRDLKERDLLDGLNTDYKRKLITVFGETGRDGKVVDEKFNSVYQDVLTGGKGMKKRARTTSGMIKGLGIIGGLKCKEPSTDEIIGIIKAGNNNPMLKKELMKRTK